MAGIAREGYLFYDDPFWVVAGILLVVALVYLGLFLHEWGHWLFARLGGYRVLGMSLGEGKVLYKRETDQGFLHLRLLPAEGYVLCVKEEGVETRLQKLMLSAGGPILTLLFVVGCFVAARQGVQSDLGPFVHVLAQACGVTAMLEIIVLGYNLWPHFALIGSGSVANDGLSMISALRRKGAPWPPFFEQALMMSRESADLAAVEEERPIVRPEAQAVYLRFLLMLYRESSAGPTPLFDLLLPIHPDAPPEERVLFLDACTDLAHTFRKDPRYLRRMDESLEKELQRSPEDPFILSRAGAISVERGEYALARLRLLEAEEAATGTVLKSYCLAWLAFLDSLTGHPREAKEQLELAAKLDPGSSAVRLVAERIFGPKHNG